MPDNSQMQKGMLDRLQGEDGHRRLVEALRLQQIVKDEEPLAAELANAAELISFEPAAGQEEIVRQGGVDNDIYFILSGRVSIVVNGREVAMRTFGQHVGEMALIDPQKYRSATVLAIEPSLLARVPEPQFSKIAEKYPHLWRRLALELADRLRQRAKFHERPNEQPILFIGSSTENLPIAREIQSGLSHDPMEVIVWTDGVFDPRRNVDSLLSAVKKSDFAVLALTPDDTVICRDIEKPAPRDNCIFELGLFMGALGGERVFIVKARGVDIKLPSDLLDLTPIEYGPGNVDSLPSRIASVSTALRKIILQSKPK